MLDKGSDPDTAVREKGADGFKKLKKSTPLDDMIIEVCDSSFEIDSLTGKANAAEKAIHLVRQIREGIYKGLVVEKIAKHYGVPTSNFSTGSGQVEKPRERKKSLRLKGPHSFIKPLKFFYMIPV
ncbi:MAG: hypothetical protein Ct9H90mP13_08880 [Pseudomonadota bacterium]|nr:MAG: hypothetical protein Ct9H90mP13_08880 [Pseudomonadota bacterium]